MNIKGKLSTDFICDTCEQPQDEGKQAEILVDFNKDKIIDMYLSAENGETLYQMLVDYLGGKIIPSENQDKSKNICIDIEVETYEGDNLISPFRLGKQEIQSIGIYEEKGIKFWVIRKDKKKPLPEKDKEIEELKDYNGRLSFPEINSDIWRALIELKDKINEIVNQRK